MKKFLLFLGLIIIIAIAAGVIYTMTLPSDNLTQAQKEEKLANVLGRKVVLTDKEKKVNQTYKDSNLSFTYPGDAILYDYKDPGFASTSGLLASFSYDLKSPRVVFNYAAVSDKSIKSIEDSPSVRLRRIPSRGYKEKAISVGNITGAEFIKDDPQSSERTIFIYNKNGLYNFSFTGPDSQALDAFVILLLSTLKFI